MGDKHYRAHQRFALRLAVTVTSVHRQVASMGHTVDMGIGGAACELDKPLRLGEAVQVVVSTDRPRILCGEVAWVGWSESSAVRLGLRFDPVSLQELERLLDTLDIASEVGT
jgi:hypothetical protein